MPESSPPQADLDLALVRYFIVLAEHGHFGRAAEALHTTQPTLSRQVHRLEHQLGARLVDRTPQGSRLTEAGEVFLARARVLLRLAVETAAETRIAATPHRITLGYTTGFIITPIVRELRHGHADAVIETLNVAWHEPRAALLDYRVDAVVARLPIDADRLRVTVLYEEPRVVVVPLDHRLAGKESVTIDDIADEPLARVRQSDPLWSAYWRIDPRPDGSRAPDGPIVESVLDKYELVASGGAIAILPASANVAGIHPDLTAIPLLGVEPSQVALVTRANDRNPLLDSVRTIAKAHLTTPSDAIPFR